jgi:hypothetical protein
MLLLSACRTTAGPKEKPAAAKPYAAQEDILLRKRIDALSKSQKQVYDCTVATKDVDNLPQVKNWISEILRGKDAWVKAFHFRATDPSVEYFVVEGNTETLFYEDHSALRFLGDKNGKNPAVEPLMAVADKHCPGQSK